MNEAQIKHVQRRVGTLDDGFWGSMSVAACQRHLRAMMPSPNPWPSQSQAALQAFYGSPGAHLGRIDVTGLGVKYGGQTVNSITCHPKVASSLLRIIKKISASPFAYVLAEYAGVFNNRPMRGGSLPSLHARAAAIDLMPGTNRNRAHWPTASTMPIEVMEFFAEEGWLSAGAFWSRDGMHHQCSR